MPGDEQWMMNAEPAMRSAKALHYLQELAEYLDTSVETDLQLTELLRFRQVGKQAKRTGGCSTS